MVRDRWQETGDGRQVPGGIRRVAHGAKQVAEMRGKIFFGLAENRGNIEENERKALNHGGTEQSEERSTTNGHECARMGEALELARVRRNSRRCGNSAPGAGAKCKRSLGG